MAVEKRKPMIILAIDPGTTESAIVLCDGTRPVESSIVRNASAIALRQLMEADVVACECLECFGMAVGREVFETAYFVGRIMEQCEQAGVPFHRVYRSQVKMHLCGTPRAKDANIRQALLDRWGGKQKAVGNKKSPGPLYGIKSHCWSALAVAVTFAEAKR